MHLSRYTNFLAQIERMTKELIELANESIMSSEKGMTDFSKELTDKEARDTKRSKQLQEEMKIVVAEFIEPSFLEKLLRVKPHVGAWTRCIPMARKEIRNLPKNDQKEAWNEFEGLEEKFDGLKKLVLELHSIAGKTHDAAVRSQKAAMANVNKLDRDLRQLDEEEKMLKKQLEEIKKKELPEGK